MNKVKGYGGLSTEKFAEVISCEMLETDLMAERLTTVRAIRSAMRKRKVDKELVEQLQSKLRSLQSRIEECRQRHRTILAEDTIWSGKSELSTAVI